MLKIGEFSKLSRISVRMLRRYDELGLLKPLETDLFTGYRYYSEQQLMCASRIKTLRDMDFKLAVIKKLLSCDDPETLEAVFCEREKELRAEIETAAYRLRLLDNAKKRLRKDSIMDYSVTIKTIPERKVAAVRMVLPSYNDESMAWEILLNETREMNLVPDDPCLCDVVFYGDEYKEKDVDIEIRKSITGDYPDTEHVHFKTVPAVTVASTIHNGSYDGLDAAMGFVAMWVKENGYEFDGRAFNIYHVSPYETVNEDEFVTEICYPVRAR